MAAVVAAGTAGLARAAFFFLFQPTSAKPADLVTVRLGGTPAGFTLADREPPFQRPIRLYLVPNRIAGAVRSPFDRRIHFVGIAVPDRQSRGVLSFTVPPLPTGDYTMARWCTKCSFGQTFFVGPGGPGTGLPEADKTLLQVEMPNARATCPATIPRHPRGWYGNGLLWTQLGQSGGLRVLRRDDGTLFQKLAWLPRKGFTGELSVRGERLDAPSPPLRVLNVFWGRASSGPYARGSWATPVEFPSEGCWRISGRVRDVALSFVVRVVASP